jgi:hypothetical protein
MQAAGEAMMGFLSQLAPDDPRRSQVDIMAFLPPHLHPGSPQGMPPVQDKVTAVGGTDLCAAHIPGIPQPGGARKEFLIAHGSITPQMLAEAKAA